MDNNSELNEDWFEDEESKRLFRGLHNRYRYNDQKYLLEMVMDNHLWFSKRVNKVNREFLKKIEDEKRKVVIFGTGEMAKLTFNYIVKHGLEKKISGFCDNNIVKQGTGFQVAKYCYPCFSVKKLCVQKSDYCFIVPKGTYENEMENQLLKAGVLRNQIIFAPYTVLCQNDMEERSDYSEIFSEKADNAFVIFGVNPLGTLFKNFMISAGRKIEYFADYCESEDSYEGIPYRNIVDLIEDDNNYYYICFDGVKKTSLQLLGIDDKHIIHLANTDGDIQYFDSEINYGIKDKSEVFVDAGALNLGTTREFIRWCKGDFDKVFAIEADRRNISLCEKALGDEIFSKAVEVIPKGLWSEETQLKFNEVEITGSSFIQSTKSDDGSLVSENTIETTTIDKICANKPATYIKMDIEGSELEALKGGKETISRYHPTLAISIYHKYEDIVTLPVFIKKLVPEYRLYLRHYHEDYSEIVLYAIAK